MIKMEMKEFIFLTTLALTLCVTAADSDTLYFRPVSEPAEPCPCPEGTTCCKLSSGAWGCCPYPQAVCCSDKVHCCPNGYKCDDKEAKCLNGTESLPWASSKTLAQMKQDSGETFQHLSPATELNDVVCPDQRYRCPDKSTCCQETSGYGCCPYERGVCCKDKTTCCPTGYTCNTASKTCDNGAISISMAHKFEAHVQPHVQLKGSDIMCPDKKGTCPDNATCCKLATGEWGCCPFPNATCCDDHVHCCKHGYACDTKMQKCIPKKSGVPVDWVMKTASRSVEKNGHICPDKKGSCPSSATCCQLLSGDYGCCPLPKATCCKDHEHCCPEGYTCDVEGGRCLNAAWEAVEWVTKMPSDPIMVTPVETGINKACPGGAVTCPDSSTCCQLASGEYACCPFKYAVCCSDHEHCCPSGFSCDVKHETCKNGDGLATPWDMKVTAQPVGVKDSTCPDLTSCPRGTTCCQVDTNGKYGCCPIPDGVCCPDRLHCCPNMMTCSVDRGTCEWNGHTKTWTSVPAYEPTPAGRAPSSNDDITCPDKQSTCPSGTTCCQMQSGWYGCCPKLNAVCCSDHLHCCASGQTCDTEKGLCKDGEVETPWEEKQLATPLPQVADVRCDDTASCPDGTTCCKQGDTYACCPLPNAVCCNDQVHCCPNGYTCDVEQGTCSKGLETVPMTSKIPIEPTPPTPVYLVEGKSAAGIKCKDGTACPSDNTCCDMGGGSFGCCPMPDAVCCSDHIHCCPSGYTCDTSAGTCNKGTESVAMTAKHNLTSDTVGSVQCADHKSSCPDGTTCCKLSSGGWGCCPYPKAMCCSDMIHCCPDGYKCGSSSCQKETDTVETVPWSKKLPALFHDKTETSNVVCPDKEVQCPTGSTCCEMATGGYGCCPFEKAVCCEDKLHCCPGGYTCNTKAGTCTKSSDYSHSVPWNKKVPALPPTMTSGDNVICPDPMETCPAGSTCCIGSSDHYGCCPMPEAVCCPDHIHCCPTGMTCDVTNSTCLNTSNSLAISWDSLKAPQQRPVEEKVRAVKCKDGQECPWGQTCCELSTGKYGCCPLPNATCCPDKVHCCPADTTCDQKHSRCNSNKNILTVTWDTVAMASPASQSAVQNVKCDDGSECPDGQTCCDMGSGKFGCCPLPQAVCCEDHEHCCPTGMKCDLSVGRCADTLQFLTSIPTHELVAAEALQAVICPDHQHECPSHSTCCLMTDASWGCCPMPRAVCCEDHEHCCPFGYSCDTRAGICQHKLPPYGSSPLLSVLRAHLHEKPEQ